MIKAIFFIVDTVHRGKKVVYAYPEKFAQETAFFSKEEAKMDHLHNAQEVFINNFLKNTDFCEFLFNYEIKFLCSWVNMQQEFFWI